MKVILPVKEEVTDVNYSDPESSCEFSPNSNSDSGGFSYSTVMGHSEAPRPRNFNLDGVHTGVPTPTTPTLTPTTLRNIEQTFIELQRETKRQEPHHNEAGFVPPPVDPVTHVSSNKSTLLSVVDTKAWLGGSTTVTPTPTVVMNRPLASQTPTPPPTRRNVGGRRPTKSSGISPEEEERRRIRRERNKLAAARCRKRRLDHTNELIEETEKLEQKKQNLQKQIQQCQMEKEQLEFLLEAHSANCRLNMASPPSPPELKPLMFSSEPRVVVQVQPHSQPRCDAATLSSQPVPPRRPQLGATAGGPKPSRPSSLPVGGEPHRVHEVAGIPITTPSSVLPFNFQSLMEGGTGLTPVGLTPTSNLSPMVPSCSSQQRSSNNGPDIASPESSYPPKLVSL